MKTRIPTRPLSVFLALVILLSSVPASSAAEALEEIPSVPDSTITESANISDIPVLDEASVPQIVGVENARARDHVLRMRDEEADELNKLVFLNSDGSRTMYLYDHPVKYVLPLNVIAQYDIAYSSRFTDADNRVGNAMEELHAFCLEQFGIELNYSEPLWYYSYADLLCNDVGFDEPCPHSSLCNNPTEQNGILVPSDYHHKRLANILAHTYRPETAESMIISFIGHKICDSAGDLHYSNGDNGNYLHGIAYDPLGILAVSSHVSVAREQITLIHEFGHLIAALDHYGFGYPSTSEMNSGYEGEPFSDNCIYGVGKDNITSVEDIVICEGCKMLVRERIAELATTD